MVKLPRKRWLWLLVPLVVVGLAQTKLDLFGLAYTGVQVQARSCATPLFTAAPIDLENLAFIVPLGNLNPPDHTLPTDHVYINMPAAADLDPHDMLPAPAAKIANVYAPGNLIITSMERVEYLGPDGRLQRADFTVNFAACRSVSGYFHHLSNVSPELLAVIEKKQSLCEEYDIQSAGATRVRRCGALPRLTLKAGELVGEAGGQFSSFDMGLTDDRASPAQFANAKRYSGVVKTVCPFDYYEAELKEKLMSSFGGFGDKQRTIPPVCGEIMQDKIGSAQGNWFYGDVKDGPKGWSKEISLVHDNVDPALGVMSVGGTFAEPFRLQFVPAHSGTVDREFGEITPGSEIYCYPAKAEGYGIKRGRQVVLQLISVTELKIEQQDGDCGAKPSFTDAAKIYNR